MERGWVRLLLWFAVIAVCGMIFFFSAQDGDASQKTSAGIVRWAITLLVSGFDSLALAEQNTIYDTATFLLRKGAHFAEFALLGFFVRLLLRSYRARRGWLWTWIAGTAYACTDELHQFFSSARNASLVDVAIDSAGVACGAWIACLMLMLFAFARRGAGEDSAGKETPRRPNRRSQKAGIAGTASVSRG